MKSLSGHPLTNRTATPEHLETLKQRTFWGREKENLVYPIALANINAAKGREIAEVVALLRRS